MLPSDRPGSSSARGKVFREQNVDVFDSTYMNAPQSAREISPAERKLKYGTIKGTL